MGLLRELGEKGMEGYYNNYSSGINDNLPPHQEWEDAEKVGCGGNKEAAEPFSSLWAA